MFKLKSHDKFNSENSMVYVVDSPVECHRDSESFIKAIGKEVEVDGNVYEITGVDMFMPATPVRIGEVVCIAVKPPSISEKMKKHFDSIIKKGPFMELKIPENDK